MTVGGLVLCEPTRGCVLMGYLLRKDDDDARYQDEDALDFEMQTKRWVVFVVGCNGLAGVSCACCTSIVTSTLVSTSYFLPRIVMLSFVHCQCWLDLAGSVLSS